MLERLLDLLGERFHDRRRGPLVARAQIAGADHRLDHRRQHPLGLDHRGRARRRPGGAAARSSSGTPSCSATTRQAGPETAWARIFVSRPAPKLLGLQPRVQVRGDRQREHAVAEEREPRVGVAAARASTRRA